MEEHYTYITEWKKSICKDDNCIIRIVWHSKKGKNYGGSKKITGCWGLEGWRMDKWNTKDLRAVIILSVCYHNYEYMSLYICQTHRSRTPRQNCNANYGLWVIMKCQCSFNFNKCTSLVVDVNNGGGYSYAGAESIWEISVPSHFCKEH